MNEFYKRSQTQNQDYSIKTKYKSNKLQNQFMLSEVRLLMLLWEGGKEIWDGFLTCVLSTTGKFDLKKKTKFMRTYTSVHFTAHIFYFYKKYYIPYINSDFQSSIRALKIHMLTFFMAPSCYFLYIPCFWVPIYSGPLCIIMIQCKNVD